MKNGTSMVCLLGFALARPVAATAGDAPKLTFKFSKVNLQRYRLLLMESATQVSGRFSAGPYFSSMRKRRKIRCCIQIGSGLRLLDVSSVWLIRDECRCMSYAESP
jgi:hypothetical protein